MNINPKQMKFSIRKISMLVAIATLPVSLRAQEIPIYRDASKPIEERIDDALSRMTLEEKVGLLHADRSYGSAGVPRLGIPENNLSDGPSGLRPEMVWQTSIHAGIHVRRSPLSYVLLQHGIQRWDIFSEKALVKRLCIEIKICFSGLL